MGFAYVKRTGRKPQGVQFTMRASKEFLAGLERAALAANDPGKAEFVRRACIERAERFGVKLER